jgi:hypothetical protein
VICHRGQWCQPSHVMVDGRLRMSQIDDGTMKRPGSCQTNRGEDVGYCCTSPATHTADHPAANAGVAGVAAQMNALPPLDIYEWP